MHPVVVVVRGIWLIDYSQLVWNHLYWRHGPSYGVPLSWKDFGATYIGKRTRPGCVSMYWLL